MNLVQEPLQFTKFGSIGSSSKTLRGDTALNKSKQQEFNNTSSSDKSFTSDSYCTNLASSPGPWDTGMAFHNTL